MPNNEWRTPQWLVEEIRRSYHLVRDVCATPENALSADYWTAENPVPALPSALDEQWKSDVAKRTGVNQDTAIWFCNPPYSRGALEPIIEAISFAKVAKTIALLNVATDTQWFHNSVAANARWIFFVKGRLRFYQAGIEGDRPRYANMLAGFNVDFRLNKLLNGVLLYTPKGHQRELDRQYAINNGG